MTHPDELSLLRFTDRDLEPQRSSEIREHLATCEACARRRDALEAETRGLRAALAEDEESLPAALQPLRAEELTWVMWLALAITATGLYALWSRLVVPWWQRLASIGIDRETFFALLLTRGARWEGWSAMGETIVNSSTAVLALLVIVIVVRTGWRRLHRSLVLLVTVMLGVISASPARAAIIETGHGDYVLRRGEVVSNDLIVTARSVSIEGAVEGDLIAFSQTVTVAGQVEGDVIAVAQRIYIEGGVGGNLRTGSEFLDVRGEVGRNVTAAAETVLLNPGAVVGGSLTIGAENARLEGRVERDLLSATETLDLNGDIGGGARMVAGELNIGERARIASHAIYYGPQPANVAPGAQLSEPLEFQRLESDSEGAFLSAAVHRAFRWGAAFLFGIVVFLVLPKWSTEAVRRARNVGLALLVGIAVLVLVPIAGFLVCLTLVGLPVGLAVLFAYALAVYGGQVFVGAWVGREVLGEPGGWAPLFGRLALGLGILHVAAALPYVGGLVSIAVTIWGLGAIGLVTFQRVGRRALAT